MALSIFTNEINSLASPQDGFAIGQPVNWIFRVDSVAVLTGNTIFFDFAAFIDPSAPFEFTNILPESGYSATLDTIGLKVTTTGATGSTSLTQEVPELSFTLQSATRVEVEVKFLMTADTNQLINSKQLNTADRYLKNGFDNPKLNDDTYGPTVYGSQRALRGCLVVGDITTGTVIDQICDDYLIEARWYDKGLAGGAAEYTDWNITFERGGVEVFELSAFEDTTIKIQVDIGAQTLAPTPRLVTLRPDGTTNTIDFLQDTNSGVNSGAFTIYGIDYVVSHTNWALVAGTVYEATFLLDHTKIQQGANYRFIALASNVAATLSNSHLSEVIPATALIPATTGTMTGEMSDYNDNYTGNCMVVAPYERIRSCVEVDKASYDAEVITNGTTGDFDSNLKSVKINVNVLTIGEVLSLDTAGSDPSVEVIDNFSIYKSCLTIRMQPEWNGKAVFIDHVYTYQYSGDNIYQDVITFRQLINPGEFEETLAVPSQTITAIRFFDASNNPVTEICETFDGPLRVEVEKIATGNDYNLIAMVKRDIEGENPEEEESYNNNTLEQLESNIIQSVDTTFGIDNLADFTIDQNLLEKGQKYLVIAVAKEENLTPPAECPIINSITNTEVTMVSGPNLDTDLDIDFVLSNYAPSTVASTSITTTTDTGGSQVDVFGAVDNGSYVYSFDFSTGFPPPAELTIQMTVTLVNGCVYSYTATHFITPIAGRITTINQDIEAD